MSTEADRRVFRAHLLGAIADAQEKAENLDTDDAEKWHTNLRELFMVADRPTSMVLNEMNREVVTRLRDRKKEKE